MKSSLHEIPELTARYEEATQPLLDRVYEILFHPHDLTQKWTSHSCDDTTGPQNEAVS